MTKKQPDYLAYLVRLWRANGIRESHTSAAKPVWRASVEDPHTHERAGFASLEELFDFLREQIAASPDPDRD